MFGGGGGGGLSKVGCTASANSAGFMRVSTAGVAVSVLRAEPEIR